MRTTNRFVASRYRITRHLSAREVLDEVRRLCSGQNSRAPEIDTLVNNAGIFIGKPFLDYTCDDFAAMTAVNLDGLFHLTQRVVRHMAEQSRGHVVNITTSLVDHARVASPFCPRVANEGRARCRDAITGHRVRRSRSSRPRS